MQAAAATWCWQVLTSATLQNWYQNATVLGGFDHQRPCGTCKSRTWSSRNVRVISRQAGFAANTMLEKKQWKVQLNGGSMISWAGVLVFGILLCFNMTLMFLENICSSRLKPDQRNWRVQYWSLWNLIFYHLRICWTTWGACYPSRCTSFPTKQSSHKTSCLTIIPVANMDMSTEWRVR